MTTDSKSPVSRRDMVGKAGIAAVGAAASLAHASAQANQPMNEPLLRNPADKYPKPPYKKQSQPWPVSPARWIRGPIMAKPAIGDRVGWQAARR